MKFQLFAFFLGLAAIDPAGAEPDGYDPVSAYEEVSMQGFKVLLNRQVMKHPEAADAARDELDRQLKEICRVVPPGPLAALRPVPIWVEWDKKKNGGAEFHPSAVWLKGNGYNPAKAGGIEVSNTRNFIAWSHAAQPCMILHELAHAYHFLVLGADDPGVAAAYRQAVDDRRYEKVDYVAGGRQKAYALTNHKEYFAELSEAYFGRNDFYPFTRSDLQRHDPAGYKTLQQVWGTPRTSAP